jgi:hypothetical protein
VSLSVLGPAIVRARPGVGDWFVWAVEHDGGIARVEDRGGLTEVVVADAPRSVDEPGVAFAAAACTIDGGVFLLTHDAPSALLVEPDGCRTAPAEPGSRELLHLAGGERLLLLSSSALETRPDVLSEALREPGHLLLERDPVELLASLFREVGRGAGIVLGRVGPSSTREV